MRPQALNPAPFLLHYGLHPLGIMQCPECKTGFAAGAGVMFCVPVENGGEVTQKHLVFCSQTCILNWYHPVQMGKA